MTIWASGYRVRSIKPTDAEKALKDGAEFIGEGFVLTVSMAIVVLEYKRSAESAARKNEEKRERFKATQDKLQAKLNTLDIRIKAVEDLIKQQQHLEENKTLLNRVVPTVVGGTEKPKYIEPPKEQLVPIADDDDDNDDHHHDETNRDRDTVTATTTINACCTTKKEEKPQTENGSGKEVNDDFNLIESSAVSPSISSGDKQQQNQEKKSSWWWKLWW